MAMSPADRPKIIGLVLGILGVFAFIAWRFTGGPKPVAPPPPGYNASLAMPSTSQIASGTIVTANTKSAGENLHEVFAGAGSSGPVGNPFRSPVKQAAPAQVGQVGGPGQYSGPTASNPERNIDIGGPMPFDPTNPGGGTGVSNSQGIRVKGIIAPESGFDALAFIQIGDRGKGFRVGDEIAPGMKVVGITSTKVSVKIGASVMKVGVGQEVRPE